MHLINNLRGEPLNSGSLCRRPSTIQPPRASPFLIDRDFGEGLLLASNRGRGFAIAILQPSPSSHHDLS
ncbi:hypothetical protein L195_g061928 [Trifolium pratense]|uniref:Uncharacterized protein n=1 Tax=Trifolium pratense TaxID=57577 RepID=A0A2K3KCP4_TRIPR|nr:hypothetical protein L195_g061928 [Trifolium pratense]